MRHQNPKHTHLHSLRKQQIVTVNRKRYLVLFSLSGMLQKELAALDIFRSNLISKTPTLAGTKDCLLPDCGCWRESYPCYVEHFGPGGKKKKVREMTVKILSKTNGYLGNMTNSQLLNKQQIKLSVKISTMVLDLQLIRVLLDFLRTVGMSTVLVGMVRCSYCTLFP